MERKFILAIVLPLVVVVGVTIVLLYLFVWKPKSNVPAANNPAVYGCNTTTWQCEKGLGGMTKDACTSKCNRTPTQLGYGCNPLSGKCELGYGTEDQGCPSQACKKQTFKCDQNTWTCNDTQHITGTTQDKCDCDPQLSTTPFDQTTAAKNLPNGQGTFCKSGGYIDKDDQPQSIHCRGVDCCASRFCGSHMAADPVSIQTCPTLSQAECTLKSQLGWTKYACEWEDGTCQPMESDVGQCAPCTKDDECDFMGKKGTCTNGVCKVADVTCFQSGETTAPINDDVPSSVSACEDLLKNVPKPDPTCSNMTTAFACGDAHYVSNCKDRNGKVWYTRTLDCLFDV